MIFVYYIILITAIITGLKSLLGRFDRELTKRETDKAYISARDKGDPNYYLSVFTPIALLKFRFPFYVGC